MKKYWNVIFSVTVFVLNMLLFWYADMLFSSYFILSVIPFFVAILLLVACIIVSVVMILRKPRALSRYLSLFIAIITIVLIFVFPFRMAKVRLELVIFEDDRAEVIDMVIDNKIIVDNMGNADLPDKYRRTSADGEIFVYQNDNEQVISFWVLRGMLSGSVELIYSSQDESLIYENETGYSIKSVIELKDHWYLVETDY